MELLNKILKKKEFRKYDKIKEYNIKIYEKSDFEDMMELYENVFPGYMSNKLWLWKNIKNPFGKFYTIIMKDNDKIIAAYSVAPKEFNIYGIYYKCVQSLDTMTLENYRGFGISTYLGKLTYEYARIKGSKFVYGFPNINSSYLFSVKLEWNYCDKSSLFIKNLSKNIEITKESKSFSIRKIKKFNDKINNFWEIYKNNYPIIIKKDDQYLNWRFKNHPFVDYKKFVIVDNDSNDIISYFVLKEYRDNKGNVFGHIVDFLIGPQELSLKKEIFTVIENFSLKKFKDNCSKISFWLPDEALKEFVLKKLGYSLTQSIPFFGYKIFHKEKQLYPLTSLKNWYITMSNNDIF